MTTSLTTDILSEVLGVEGSGEGTRTAPISRPKCILSQSKGKAKWRDLRWGGWIRQFHQPNEILNQVQHDDVLCGSLLPTRT